MTRFYTRKRDIPKLKPGQRIDFRKGKGYFVVPAPPPKPAPVIKQSVFAGKGVFTTDKAESVKGLEADWVACQADPEGDLRFWLSSARSCLWMARPTQEQADVANRSDAPFIAQAENEDELVQALALSLSVPKALLGNPSAWSIESFNAAAKQGWDLILEWYWNVHPWETRPDAANYPRLASVCFGIFPPLKPLADYRRIWKGSFSVWRAEDMTPEDRKEFNAI